MCRSIRRLAPAPGPLLLPPARSCTRKRRLTTSKWVRGEHPYRRGETQRRCHRAILPGPGYRFTSPTAGHTVGTHCFASRFCDSIAEYRNSPR